jgi:hypothetical protein
MMTTHFEFKLLNRAAPQLKRLVASFPPRRPGFDPGSGQVEFVVDKVALGTSVSPANLHSTNCSTITLTYHLGPEVAAVQGA